MHPVGGGSHTEQPAPNLETAPLLAFSAVVLLVWSSQQRKTSYPQGWLRLMRVRICLAQVGPCLPAAQTAGTMSARIHDGTAHLPIKDAFSTLERTVPVLLTYEFVVTRIRNEIS